jgi:acetate kinase
VVHGGEAFHGAHLINDQVLDALKENISLAPLHNPANILGIEVATQVFGAQCPQVGVFDTAFHATMPPKAFLYAIPYELYEKHGVRRYGFHGTSHQYVGKQAAKILQKPFDKSNFVTFHLGNGSSMSAIRNGKCIDTTMGLTPLEGLVMGTRSGDVDPALHPFLNSHLKMSLADIDKMLNKKSGLFGLCGDSDIRRIQERVLQNDKQADRALDVLAHRARKYLGSYLLELEGSLDALVFTAGIGENSSMVRERICRNLGFLGIEIDPAKNAGATMGKGWVEIQTSASRSRVMVIPTDEERSIAEQTFDIITGESTH